MKTPQEILAEALSHKPIAIYCGFSGGDDSLATVHYMMNNVPNCKVFHANTGIGIEKTRQFVRDTCEKYGWPLVELRAKEDCGQDYRQLVLERGFPGPGMHFKMYQRLKERVVRLLVRSVKTKRRDKVMIATGIRRDESVRRMGYEGREVNFVGSQMWVNPLYWWTKHDFMEYIAKHKLDRNPVSKILGMSGECLCGAFARPGEKALIRLACPQTADYLDALEIEVKAAGHNWLWEEAPPKKKKVSPQLTMPFCVGCDKTGDLP